MSAFDMKVRVAEMAIQLNRQSDEELATEAELVLGIMAVTVVGPGQALPIPLGTVRVPLDKSSIEGLASQLTQAAEQMKDRPNIEIATDMGAVERTAEFTEKLR